VKVKMREAESIETTLVNHTSSPSFSCSVTFWTFCLCSKDVSLTSAEQMFVCLVDLK
jgi:hypothetical protein